MKNFFPALALVAACSVQASEFNLVQPEQSAIGFVYQQMGVSVEGKFKRFTSQLRFDPAKLSAAKASFEVDLASVDTGSADGDQEVSGKTWFNTQAFPTAQFVSSGIKALGGNKYEVTGQMRIKGKSQAVVIPATFSAQGRNGVFDGSFTLRRADFNLGEGVWAKFDIVANNVLIKFHFTTTSK